MTTKKAIKILDWLIEQETIRAEGFVDPKHSWNHGFDCMKDLAKSLSDSIKNEVMILQILKKRDNSKMQPSEKDARYRFQRQSILYGL